MNGTVRDDAVHLVWLGRGDAPAWEHGTVLSSPPTPAGVRAALETLRASGADGLWLLWDGELGPPDSTRVAAASRERGDVKHAGLLLGLGGAPRALDFVSPLWMLNLDATGAAQATSWRISFRACLMRSAVLDAAGLPDDSFSSLDACSLHYGHTALRNGVLTRSTTALLPPGAPRARVMLPLADELRFVTAAYGRRWAWWAATRLLLTRGAGPVRVLRALRERPPAASPRKPPGSPPGPSPEAPASPPPVSVLVPTLDRYAYLHELLEQLRDQTVAPLEILVVDQTAPAEREADLAARHPGLPLRVFHLDEPGQCTARNLALSRAEGELVLFLDDDDEVEPALIARHLASLAASSADVSSGVVDEVGAEPADVVTTRRLSDVFPTNNTLACLRAVMAVGSFDPAYDKGQRADHDLGMRLYLSGAVMMLDPTITVFHHRAPRGGLRAHGARVTTRAASRSSLTHRNLPTVSDLYLGLKYYSRRQVMEQVWITLLATVRLHGPLHKRILKAAISLGLMPRSVWLVRARWREAERLLREPYSR